MAFDTYSACENGHSNCLSQNRHSDPAGVPCHMYSAVDNSKSNILIQNGHSDPAGEAIEQLTNGCLHVNGHLAVPFALKLVLRSWCPELFLELSAACNFGKSS